MKRIHVFGVLLFTILLASCKKESLQTYLVDSKEKSNFFTLDLSTNILPINTDKMSAQDKEVFNSVRKVNIVFLEKRKAAADEYTNEKQKLKSIFKSSDYKELIKFNDKNASGTVYYLGKPESVDEIVVFGYGEEYGVGVARLLGNNMKPNEILRMVKNSDLDGNNESFKKIKELVKNRNL